MASEESREAGFRFGLVFLLTLTLLVFVIVAPTANWSRAIAVALQWLALLTVVATSRARADVRRSVAVAIVALMAFTVVGEGAGELSDGVVFAISGALSAAIPVALIGGLMRLLRTRGVTPQVVAGALTLYLLTGLVFAWVVGFVAQAQSTPYFAEVAKASTSQIVYYSFTALTTTGFGDLTAATHVGRALAVVETLLGQLYLVTVIGILVGSVAGNARRTPAARNADGHSSSDPPLPESPTGS